MFSQRRIKAVADIKRAVRQPYAWPGGYPLFAITNDAEGLCIDCLKAEFTNACHSTLHNIGDSWHVYGIDINYESDVSCCHCGSEIERAYD